MMIVKKTSKVNRTENNWRVNQKICFREGGLRRILLKLTPVS